MSTDDRRQRSRSRSRERDAPTGIAQQSAYSRHGNLPPALLYGGGMGALGSIPNLPPLPAFAAATVSSIKTFMHEGWCICYSVIRPGFVFLTGRYLLGQP
jgi:hypothetical protein